MPKTILWFDVETVPETNDFESYPKKQARIKKNIEPEMAPAESYFKKSGIYPEFSKVACIACKDMVRGWIFSWEEKDILERFFALLDGFTNDYVLGWFNIVWFDIPFLWKREIINGIKPPKKLCIWSQKPREVDVVDVMQIRRQTSFSCSLDLLSLTLLWETPKEDGDGSDVFDHYYSWEYKWIEEYCMRDVEYTERCYDVLRLRKKPILVKKEIQNGKQNKNSKQSPAGEIQGDSEWKLITTESDDKNKGKGDSKEVDVSTS